MDLYQEIERLKKENEELRKENLQLKEIIQTLIAKIASLEERLSRYENPKNSRNSSVPPSQDYTRTSKNRSLREPSGKKPGGQQGHKGTTLEMVENPDKIIEYIPDFCRCCGYDISQLPTDFVEKRQEVVLPVIKPIYVEHRVYQRTCICGNKVKADFPSGITSGISYGENIENLAAYMNVRQYVPFQRLSEIFRHVFNLPISEGSLVNAINRLTEKAIPAYELIHNNAKKSIRLTVEMKQVQK